MRLKTRHGARQFLLFCLLLSCLVFVGCASKQGAKIVSAPEQGDSAPQAATPVSEEQTTQSADGPEAAVSDFDDDFDDDFDRDYQDPAPLIADPLEPWNRFWFTFNDYVFTFVWRPISIGYNTVMPKPVRKGVSNFFYNLKFPLRFINNLLQGKFLAAGVEFSRFVGNTAFGLGGLYDITSRNKGVVETHPEDFGQTLGYWGVGQGFYIVWPLLGPSTLRDSVGMCGDYFADPVVYVDPWFLPYSNPEWEWVSWATYGARTISITAATVDSYVEMRDAAFEPYTAFRNAYVQHRNEESKE